MHDRLMLAAELAALLAVSSAYAHHSFLAEFDIARPVELTGAVVRVEWTNPHAWLHISVKNDQEEAEEWAVEMLGVVSLARSGMTPKTVKPGDVLTIKGYGARNGTNTANASSVIRTATGELLWTSDREE
jgi:hypothetical protein